MKHQHIYVLVVTQRAALSGSGGAPPPCMRAPRALYDVRTRTHRAAAARCAQGSAPRCAYCIYGLRLYTTCCRGPDLTLYPALMLLMMTMMLMLLSGTSWHGTVSYSHVRQAHWCTTATARSAAVHAHGWSDALGAIISISSISWVHVWAHRYTLEQGNRPLP